MAAKAVAAPVAELTGPLATLKEKFGEAIRPGDFEGVVIANDKLIEVATYIRDELGYDYLTNLTGVDYLAQSEMEVVYHALHTRAGGAPLVFKARTPRDNAVVPSLISVWPGILEIWSAKDTSSRGCSRSMHSWRHMVNFPALSNLLSKAKRKPPVSTFLNLSRTTRNC